jgi:cation:H+ antiporter
MIEFYILIFGFSCLILVKSGALLVRALTRIAQFLGWKEFVVASVLMAFATSLPEIFIGVTSALHQQPELSFGNVIGSNIIALTLVIGIGAILAGGIKMEGKVLKKSTLYAIAIALLPFLLILDGKISRIDGTILILSLVFYFRQLLAQEERFTKVFSNDFKREWVHFKLFLKDLGIFLVGVFLLLLSAEGVVFSSLNLAAEFNLPLIIIGLFLVAFGTSIPEITFGVRSVILGHKEMVVGDAIGSVVVNSSLALGIVALISPFSISFFSPYLIGIIFTVITVFFFFVFSRTGQEITRKEALFLLEIYILFVLVEILTK